MSSIIIFTLSILLISPFTISSPIDAIDGGNGNLTAYEVIQSYGFPKGILPIGVTGYELDKSTGKFKAFFNGTCSFSLEGSYNLKYQSTIGGIISKGRLKDLTGVSVKVLFFWLKLNIVEVYTTEDELGFSVGIASAGFPIDNFEMCPQCGCGMDCNGVVDGQRGPPGTVVDRALRRAVPIRDRRPFAAFPARARAVAPPPRSYDSSPPGEVKD